MALTLKHQTAAQFTSRFWGRVIAAQSSGNKTELARLVTWALNRIQAGDLTSDQVRLSFNAAFSRSLTTAQWNTFVTIRLVPMKDRYLAMLAESEL